MIGRVKDYVCLTSVSLMLDVAVTVIRRVRQKPASASAIPPMPARLKLQESRSSGV